MPFDVLEPTRQDHAARMNRVMDHIQAHLADPLDLARLAAVACYSPFHFHRIFHAWTGETLQQFVHRLRLERAAHRLTFDTRSTITDIALDCGFSGSSPFARAFRKAFGVTASDWRTRKIGRGHRHPGQASAPEGMDPWRLPHPRGRNLGSPAVPFPLDVHIRSLPPATLAYLREFGPHGGDLALFSRLFSQLTAWADPRSLLRPDTRLLSLIHDPPDLTPEARQRWEAALTVPLGTLPDGPIGIQPFEGGPYALARILANPEEILLAWDTLLGDWLPDSGTQPDHRPAVAFCLAPPDAEGRLLLEIGLPVQLA